MIKACNTSGDQCHGFGLPVRAGFGEDTLQVRSYGSRTDPTSIRHVVKRQAICQITSDHGLRPREAEEFPKTGDGKRGRFRIAHDDQCKRLRRCKNTLGVQRSHNHR